MTRVWVVDRRALPFGEVSIAGRRVTRRACSTADLPPYGDPETGVPLEATASDWQEQQETVLIDPELEEHEQRE
jgi:hypothetical protein